MLERIEHTDVIELRLARKPVNALAPALVSALREAIEAAPDQGYKGLILSGSTGIFSGGLDVPALIQLNRSEMGAFWTDFSATMRALASSPIPCVAAITGHSPAGGAVLAMWCDYRVMAAGDYRIGLNETQVGLAIPPVIVAGLQRLVGAHRGERLVVEGSLLASDDALAQGMVDELAALDQVVNTALGWLQRHLELPRHAFNANRAIARRSLVELFADPALTNVEGFLDGWFGADTQRSLQILVDRLTSKS